MTIQMFVECELLQSLTGQHIRHIFLHSFIPYKHTHTNTNKHTGFGDQNVAIKLNGVAG